MKNEIILYRPDELSEHIEVRLDEETVWLNRQQIASLFVLVLKTIGKHINTIFTEGELLKESTVANFATVQMEGNRKVERLIKLYSKTIIPKGWYNCNTTEN